MENRETAIPENVLVLNSGGKTFYLLGTAHISRGSVAEVRQTIESVRPDTVCLELCPARYQAMLQAGAASLGPLAAWKKGRFQRWLLGGVIALFYKYLSRKFAIQPGAEMLEAIRQADKLGALVLPVDREVEITLDRLWNSIGFLGKIKLFARLLVDFLFSLGLSLEKIEAMKQQNQVDLLIAAFARTLPEVKKVLIDERDEYIASQLAWAPGASIVVVVGAGHVSGIVRELENAEKTAILSDDENN